MSFTLHLRPDVEKDLARQAEAQGMPVETYIQMLIERQIALQHHERKISPEAFEVELDGLAAYSEKIPLLPLSAFTRDQIYRDHD
ncbi:MAG TPA: hypothetical protein VFB79_10325 [Candidatus Angelobacter sp.]|nr:hypothetical protein [Candidatus Angelobacter sp.]